MPPTLSLSLLLAACSPAKITLDTGALGPPGSSLDTGSVADSQTSETAEPGSVSDSGGSDSGGSDSGDTDSGDTGGATEPPRPDALWCLDFEDGTLEGAGYGEADLVVLYDGALVFNAAEGDDFSALNGEESLRFRGERALALRSSDEGEVSSVAIATSPLFVVEQPALFWWLLSEVDERGVYLGLDLISEDGLVLASAELPPRTGGYVPGLEPEYQPIDGFPEIVVGPGTPGDFSAQQIDLSPWLGQTIKLRIYQHTRQEGQGFFTLLDDICHGAPMDKAEAIALGDPMDHGA